LEKSWSKNRPERSEHATGVEPAGDHQWWAIFLTFVKRVLSKKGIAKTKSLVSFKQLKTEFVPID